MKLKMNSQGMAGNSLKTKGKLNTPMNTIMAMAQATCKDRLQVRKCAISTTVNEYLTVRQAESRRLKNVAVVKEYLTTEAERIAADRVDMKKFEDMKKDLNKIELKKKTKGKK